MLGIHHVMASHKLNISPISRPIWKKIRLFHLDWKKIIKTKIDKLLTIGFIREVKYRDWLANMVVVPKRDGRWIVCVDYTNLNDIYPNDSFLLPQIDQIVDAITGHGMLSFLDAFFRYHQIPMFHPDEEKITFVTPQGLYYYRVMSFVLKNASTTYQRLMKKIFKSLIGRIVEVYIDDIVVKSKTRVEHV